MFPFPALSAASPPTEREKKSSLEGHPEGTRPSKPPVKDADCVSPVIISPLRAWVEPVDARDRIVQHQEARAMRAAPSAIGWSDTWRPYSVAHLEWPGQTQPLQRLGDTGEPARL